MEGSVAVQAGMAAPCHPLGSWTPLGATAQSTPPSLQTQLQPAGDANSQLSPQPPALPSENRSLQGEFVGLAQPRSSWD